MQIDFRARRQIDPTEQRTTTRPCYWDRLAPAAIHKKRPSYCIKFDTRETKVERFIPARFVVTDIRQIAKRDPRSQLAALTFEIELVPDHLAISERLRMIRTSDARSTGNRRNARRKQDRQKNRDSHATNLGRRERSFNKHAAEEPLARRGWIFQHTLNGGRPAPQTGCKPAARNTT